MPQDRILSSCEIAAVRIDGLSIDQIILLREYFELQTGMNAEDINADWIRRYGARPIATPIGIGAGDPSALAEDGNGPVQAGGA